MKTAEGVTAIYVGEALILRYVLLKTTRRLTFDIIYQRFVYRGADEGEYWRFVASNGYEIISRSRMDIQTERIWLKGGCDDERSIRSGTMTFSSDIARDDAFSKFSTALEEWCEHMYVLQVG
jgi:hypothetical protein